MRTRTTEKGGARRVRRFLEAEVWTRVPSEQLGHPPDKAERESILGYGSEGV